MAKRDDVTRDALSWLASAKVDRAAGYVQRGRKHQGLTDSDLIDQWTRAFKFMAADMSVAEVRRAEEDFSSELAFRGIEPPYDAVADELESVFDAALMAPRDASRDMQKDLVAFKANRDKGKH